jgi:hypothetical protein
MVTSCIGRKAARTTSFGSPAVPPTADRSMPGGRFRAPAEKVLFQLPITEGWIRQFVLAQSLIGHSSDRGVQELAAVLVGYHLSLGTIHNILSQAADRAQKLNQQEDLRLLPGIRVGAHDEIFQGGRPVLVGIDTDSTYFTPNGRSARWRISWSVVPRRALVCARIYRTDWNVVSMPATRPGATGASEGSAVPTARGGWAGVWPAPDAMPRRSCPWRTMWRC